MGNIFETAEYTNERQRLNFEYAERRIKLANRLAQFIRGDTDGVERSDLLARLKSAQHHSSPLVLTGYEEVVLVHSYYFNGKQREERLVGFTDHTSSDFQLLTIPGIGILLFSEPVYMAVRSSQGSNSRLCIPTIPHFPIVNPKTNEPVLDISGLNYTLISIPPKQQTSISIFEKSSQPASSTLLFSMN